MLTLDPLISDAGEDAITVPGLAGGAIGTKYDWNTTYAANDALGGREVSIPQGKIVGGSTKLNRMVFDRGSQADFDRWAELGNDGWDYAGLLPYFIKVWVFCILWRVCRERLTKSDQQAETFTPPAEDLVSEYSMPEYDASVHGESGNIQVSFSPFFWPTTRKQSYLPLCTFVSD